MAISYSTTAAQIILNSMDTRIDGGTLILQTSGDVEVATITIAATNAFASVTGSVGTFATMTADADATGGLAEKFEIQQSDTTVECTGTVSTILAGTGDIQITDNTIAVGASLDMSSGSPITFTIP